MSEKIFGLPLFDQAGVRAVEAAALERAAKNQISLMERAGRAAFEVAERHFDQQSRYGIICGAGNNAGDALVFARHASAAGRQVKVLMTTPAEKFRGDAAEALHHAIEAQVELLSVDAFPWDFPSVLVDGLLGIGLNRPPSDDLCALIDKINQSKLPVVALDVPSGLQPTTGHVETVAINATLTVSFLAPKSGLYTAQGRAHCGHIEHTNLEIAEDIYSAADPLATLIDWRNIANSFPRRNKTAHKGDFGHALLIGGAPGYDGAITLAASAAARTGAGLTTVATHPQSVARVGIDRPELMVRAVADLDDLAPLLEQASVIGIGPGLGQDSWSEKLLGRALDFRGPIVIDADALNLLAARGATDDSSPRNWLLTPHPGEASRLLDVSTAEIAHDRFAAAREIASRYQAHVLLKGSGTVIALASSGQAFVIRDGNPGMASGGMGDVLTGIVASLCAQRHTSPNALILGALIHARAADLAALGGERGLLASDLIGQLRRVVNP